MPLWRYLSHLWLSRLLYATEPRLTHTAMCLIFTCGEHTFRKEVEGYEGIVCRCHNCGNYSGHVLKSHPWFTFCFVVRDSLPQHSTPSLPRALPRLRSRRHSRVLVTHMPRTLARDPILDPWVRRHTMSHMQLCATLVAPAGCPGHERRRRRRRRRPIARSTAKRSAAERSAARLATTTPRSTTYTIRMISFLPSHP